MEEKFEFIGSISWKKLVFQNMIAFVLTTLIFMTFANDFKTIFIITVSLNSLLILSLIHKVKVSKIILTESDCSIYEAKLFGLIKIYRKFDIEKKEKDTLINYFKYLQEKEKNIHFFTIPSINNLLKYNVIFANKNIKL